MWKKVGWKRESGLSQIGTLRVPCPRRVSKGAGDAFHFTRYNAKVPEAQVVQAPRTLTAPERLNQRPVPCSASDGGSQAGQSMVSAVASHLEILRAVYFQATYTNSNTDTMAPGMSLFSINAVLILNAEDGSRLFAKYEPPNILDPTVVLTLR